MEQIITYISGHFLESLILVLIATLFFKETITAVFRQWLGIAKQDRIVEMAETVDALKLHFNEETSHLLSELRERQILQCSKLDEIRDILRDIGRNGIRIRK